MGLSNTATPKYYGQFRDKVLAGKIPVCQEISQEMNRIDALIADPTVYYDEDAVEGWIRFCENELVLTDGSDFVMLDSFKLWGEELFGWYYYVDVSVYEPANALHGGGFARKKQLRRLINKQYLIVARSNAKSMYLMAVQAYTLVIEPDTTHQITTAPTMKQSEEVVLPIKNAIQRARGPLFKFMTLGSLNNTTGNRMNRPQLASTKMGIQNFLSTSILEIRAMSIDKLQGLRTKIATVDEWLSGVVREDVVGAIEQGSAKVADYMIIAASSEGTVRNGSGDDIKMELLKILHGDYANPHVSIFYYRLDDIKEVSDPAMWEKANPNIGITVSYETIQLDVKRAENNPAAHNDIVAKRFNIPMEGYTFFFTYEETLPTVPPRPNAYHKMSCSLGIDLSQGDDFCAFTFLFPLGGERFGIVARSYVSERTMFKLAPSMRIKYDEFLSEGTLIVMPGTILDLDEVYEDLEAFIDENEYEVLTVGYDPYNAKGFMSRWEKENGPFGIEKVPQGVKTESVPLGEIKKLAEDGGLYFWQSIMTFTMGNSIVIEDNNGNRKLLKTRYDQKIDNVSALLDGFVAWKNNKEAFE